MTDDPPKDVLECRSPEVFAGDVANDFREIATLLERGDRTALAEAKTKATEHRREYERRAWGETKEENEQRSEDE
jgi:hypothetical protein